MLPQKLPSVYDFGTSRKDAESIILILSRIPSKKTFSTCLFVSRCRSYELELYLTEQIGQSIYIIGILTIIVLYDMIVLNYLYYKKNKQITRKCANRKTKVKSQSELISELWKGVYASSLTKLFPHIFL